MGTTAVDTSFLQGGGEMGALIRAHDWPSTPLGAPEFWPQSLRSALSILLPSRAQIALFWGPDLITLYNDAYRPVFGAKHPGALGMPIRDSWAELWRAGLRELFEGVLTTGEAFWARDRLFIMERYGFSEETYFDVSYDPVRDESGNVGGVFCIVSDTTGRVIGDRRARTLRDLAARTADSRTAAEVCRLSLDALQANPHDVPFALLYLADADGRMILECGSVGPGHALAEAQRWLTTSAGLSVADVEDLTAPAGPWDRPPEQAAVLPLSIPGRDATAGLLVCGLSPMLQPGDDYRGFLEMAARQISNAVGNAQAYEAERRRAEALAELDRAKTAFFSNVSHEFRTPLTLMLGPLEETLASSPSLSPDDRSRLELAQRNAQRMLKLVNTLLDFSRIEAGRTEASFAPVDLAALTTDLASVFRSAMERAGLEFDVRCERVAPVYVDRDLWEKIVFNLLSNALKFTHQGRVEVSLRQEGDSALLVVTDTGIGIPPTDVPRVFDRFHRVREAQGRSVEGTGIGLALVRELVRLHGGTIAVESTPSQGSRFTVGIPFGSAHLPADRLTERAGSTTPAQANPWIQEAEGWLAPPVAATAGRAAAGRVLLADDNADMREYVRRILGAEYDVDVAGDGVAALAAARARVPDLVLADVMMPGMDGFELLKALRADDRLRHVPVVLLSARAGEEARVEGVRAGADDYLVKPFSARELLARVGSRIELHRLQRHIRHTGAEVEHLLSQSPVPIAVLRGPELVFDLVNDAYCQVVGGRDLRGKPLAQALPELQGQGLEELLLGVMNSGRAHVGRETHLRLQRNGRLEDTWWTFVYSPMGGPDGTPDRVIAICNEVTREVEARQAISDSEARYRHVFESAPVGIWAEDFTLVKHELDELKAAGVDDLRAYCAAHPEFVHRAVGLVRLRDVNSAGVRMLGAAEKSQLLSSLHTVVTPETTQAFVEKLAAIAEGRTYLETESAMRTVDGRRIDVLVSITFPPGPLDNVLVTRMDITARKMAEADNARLHAQREELIEQLRQADRRKDEFIATLSHELRNPLAPLRNSLAQFRLIEQNPVRLRLIEMMERQVNHLVRLVDDLLEISRINRGSLELRREPVDVATIVRHAMESSDPLMQAGSHTVTLSLPGEALWLLGDQVRLVQVISNLLNNAARYTPAGGEISVTARRDGGSAVIAVRDNGNGIDPDMLPRVFELFHRGSQHNTAGGLGIGLAIARRLVELHGGTIHAESGGAGRGSEFTVRLPLTSAPSLPAPEDGGALTVPEQRILVVDDNLDSAQSLALLLAGLGAEIRVAHDGAGALREAAAWKPDTLLLDIGMPDMDGYEVARRLRADASLGHLRIVAVTGWGQEEDRSRAREAGIDHHLTKPVNIRALTKLLRRVRS